MQTRNSDELKMAVNLYSLIKKDFIVLYLIKCSLFTVATQLEAEIKVGSRLVCSFSWLALLAICVNDSQEHLQQMQNWHGLYTNPI